MRYTLVFLSSVSFFILGMCINKYCGWYISNTPPSWDSVFNFIAIISALVTLFYQIGTSKKSEIESTINTLFLDIDSIKFKANSTNGPDALRSYKYGHKIEDEVNVVDSLSSILIQFDSLLPYFKNGSNKNLKLRAFTLYYAKIMWASEDLVLTVLFTYQELAKKYIRISEMVYNELKKKDLIETNESFLKKVAFLKLSLIYYNNLNEKDKSIFRASMAHFHLLSEPGIWQTWNHDSGDALSNYYNSKVFISVNDIVLKTPNKGPRKF